MTTQTFRVFVCIDCGSIAETAGDLLLHFDHAQIALSEVVVKIHSEIFQEAEESLLGGAQAIEEIAGGTLFASTPCPGWGGSSWVGPIPLIKQGES